MKKSFFNRVDAERSVLAVVNGLFRGQAQLTGLSDAALQDWQKRNEIESASKRDILNILINLGDACQRLSDRSRETFEPLELKIEAQIFYGLEALKAIVITPLDS